jgi:hypothetical protein
MSDFVDEELSDFLFLVWYNEIRAYAYRSGVEGLRVLCTQLSGHV